MLRQDWMRLRSLIEERCLKLSKEPFKLSSGRLSNYYFECKNATLDGEGLNLTAEAFIEEIQKLAEEPKAIGGLTMGADFITAAVALRCFEHGIHIQGSIVRKEPKEHGTKLKIENELPKGTPIVVVDDVLTTGKSTRQACEEFNAAGYHIVGIIVLIDREEGGKVELEARFGKKVRAIFTTSDFPKAVKADERLRGDKGRLVAAA